jgi:hypothetical protein
MMLMRCVAMALVMVGCRGADTPGPPAEVAPPRPVATPDDPAGSVEESARQFAQAFYDWYVPLSNRTPRTAYDSILTQGTRLFTPTLRQALQRDVDAQRAAEEIVSVVGDYDPFLNAQDPCVRYEARNAVPAGRTWQVAIDARCGDGRSTLAVLVDLEPANAGWHFANFRQPDDSADDLVSRLRAAQARRAAASAGGAIPSVVVVLEFCGDAYIASSPLSFPAAETKIGKGWLAPSVRSARS